MVREFLSMYRSVSNGKKYKYFKSTDRKFFYVDTLVDKDSL